MIALRFYSGMVHFQATIQAESPLDPTKKRDAHFAKNEHLAFSP